MTTTDASTTQRPLRILMAASEVAPVAKTGGLADVTAALALRLQRRGHDCRLIVPLYKRLHEAGLEFRDVPGLEAVPVRLGKRSGHVAVRETTLASGLRLWCLDAPALYHRDGIYTQDPDEVVRFAVLARAALSVCQESNWAPDIVHAHDWHVALMPLYVKLLASWERLFADTRSLLTIHNIGYQGTCSAEQLTDIGLDDAVGQLDADDLKRGVVNLLKTGVRHADGLSTVSTTYAREIQTEAYGMGLEGLLRERSERLVGIVNGVDVEDWDPQTDPLIPAHFSSDDPAGKGVCKQHLLQAFDVAPDPTGPVFGIVSRLAGQKGFELLFEPFRELLGFHDARLCVLGSGERKYVEGFAGLQMQFPSKVGFYEGYSNERAHLVEAGADVFLMPSRYEPCGLNQMYSLRYGTVPVVRKTGGLADTVKLFDAESGQGNGIVFEHFDVAAVRWALEYTLDLWGRPDLWTRMVRNGMAEDHGWERRAGEYEELYERLRELPAATA